jgi:hypothetical protein
MDRKKTEAIDVNIDELALSLVGWQVEVAQARLITEDRGTAQLTQQLAVSCTLRFISEDWTDRFVGSDDDSYAPEVYLTVNRRDSPAPSSNFKWVVLEKIKEATKGLIRVSAKSDSWPCETPLAAKDIDLRLTAYDFCEISNEYINSQLELPSATTTHLEIIVLDETRDGSFRSNVTVANAYVSKGDYSSTLILHTEGTFEFGSAEDLLKLHRHGRDAIGHVLTLKEAAPFKVAVPKISFEVLDNTEFLLDVRTLRFHGYIQVDDQGNFPRRPPRWVGRNVINMNKLPGDPSRVVVRISDSTW